MKTILFITLAVTFLSACNENHYQIAASGGEQPRVWRVDTRSGEVTMCVFAPQGLRCVQSPAELSQWLQNLPATWPPTTWKDGVPYVAPANP